MDRGNTFERIVIRIKPKFKQLVMTKNEKCYDSSTKFFEVSVSMSTLY